MATLRCPASSASGLSSSFVSKRNARSTLPSHRGQSNPKGTGCHVARCEAAARGSREVKASSASSPLGTVVVTDETVPEGHQGLHGFLYGESGADVHDSSGDEYSVRAGEDEGQVLLSVPEFVTSREGHRLAGVYAVFDAQGTLQYVGYSRNIVLSISGHSKHPETGKVTSGVRVRVFRDPALVTRARLDEARTQWMQSLMGEGGGVPPGNTPDGLGVWEGRDGPLAVAATGGMTEADRAEYEEKKLKLRKAMGENLHDEVEGETVDARQRRINLLQAVEGDNWSGVINEQTSQTRQITPPPVQPPPPSPPQPSTDSVISPFEKGQAGGSKGGEGEEGGEGGIPMTVENVDRVLEAVRPYLISDGGNVDVIGVKDGVVELLLQGACGSCPSANTTMKMGIERVLREKFGKQLLDVREVGGALEPVLASVKAVDAHLDMLRPAIKNFNGSIEVLSVEGSTCEVKYVGPPPVFMGVQAAIKDKFPMITTVKNVES